MFTIHILNPQTVGRILGISFVWFLAGRGEDEAWNSGGKAE